MTGSMIQPDGNARWGPGILFSDSWSEDKYNGFTHLQMHTGKKSRWWQKGNDFFLMLFCVFKKKVFLEVPWKLPCTASWTEFIGKGGGSRSLTFSFLWEDGEKRKLGKPVGWAKHVSATGGLQELGIHASLSGFKGYIPFINLYNFV